MNVSKNTILYIGVSVALIIVLAGILLKLESMWGGEFLDKWASIVTIISLVMAPVVYFWKKWQSSTDERARASKNLHTELDDALDGLSEKKHDDLKKVEIPDDEEAYFMNRMFNHDFYDSLVFSGKINFLPPKIQQPVQDTFQKIKDHNKHLRKIRDIEDDAGEDEDVSKKTARYYKMLHKIEEELLSDIPAVKEKLEEEFKIG